MTDLIQIKHASVAVKGAQACSFLNELVHNSTKHQAFKEPFEADLELQQTAQGLQLTWNKANKKPLRYHIDFVKTASQLRSFPAPKQGAFNQSLGKKTKSIIDVTGGWGGDALLMSLQGYDVTVIERLPVMAALLGEAFNRLANSVWASKTNYHVPKFICGNAIDVLKHEKLAADCVYMDPMFPVKRKKSAASNKHMQLLQWLACSDEDAADLADLICKKYPRLAVKRPDYAEPIIANPSTQFSSKLVHYDVYLNSN